ncbi:Glucose-6-phosphate 1-dehydrogenase 3 [Phytophthora citrophthora]|uniref:Glucose-6-phosphate 1-dehydrogenase 3 n=1 Tax=Phytophthora citrophthora TaxID=4793 RepID=A0AAD9G1T9_9STRA|nr:Glucose-6-phosphate 1-dehydrogenase 3 [Phytophthora citrophthora]
MCLLPIAFAFVAVFGTAVHLQYAAAIHQAPQKTSTNTNVVNVIVAGATGDLAAKYLWVALFRLALKGQSTYRRTYRFYAGASDTLERGSAWIETFFDKVFAERVCGDIGNEASTAQIKCLEFLEKGFKPNVEYAPLRTENHYRDLGRRLTESNDKTEEGRLVYLAIPPQFFLQSCEMIHRHLRPLQKEMGSVDPFLRVVVEKPFGRDLQTAHELAMRLREMYKSDELYVMDHYAGKPVVHALRNYFHINAAALHPIWNSQHIRDIHIEMTETSTLENRVHYFDSAGIIRDIMVNHLQLLLNVAVTPSFESSIFSTSIPPREFARELHERQLHFIKSLKHPRKQTQGSFFVAQYDEYEVHYEEELDKRLAQSNHFTPTAAMVELTSSLDAWENTTFRLAAAKATAKRLLAIIVTFKDSFFSNIEAQSCTFTVIIQRELNTDSHHSHRIEWSCDIEKLQPRFKLPGGWKYLHPDNNRILVPVEATAGQVEHGIEAAEWELGDEPSAYDILLREVASGSMENFADLDEVEAAWELWTPLVNAAESIETSDTQTNKPHETDSPHTSKRKHASYPAGTSPWKQLYHSRSQLVSPSPRDEL